MYNSIKKYFVLAVFATTGCAVSTPLVQKIDPEEENFVLPDNTVVYALPKTVFESTFAISKIKYQTPKCSIKELAKYRSDSDTPTDEQISEQLKIILSVLGLKENEIYGEEEDTLYALHKAELNALTTADENKVFAIHFPKPSNTANTSLMLSLSSSGLIQGIEASSVSQATKLINSTVSLATGIVKNRIAVGAGDGEIYAPNKCDTYVQQYESLKTRLASVSSTLPFPKDTLETIHLELKAQMATILSFFVGVGDVTNGQIRCALSPTKIPDDVKSTDAAYPLFSFDKTKGFSGFDNSEVCEVSDALFVNNEANAKTIMLKVSELTATLRDNPIINAYSSDDSAKNAGFFYNVPKDALVSLTGHTKIETVPKRYTIPQLGYLRSLPQVTGNSPSLNVQLHPETGALKSVKVTNDAADLSSVISTLSTSYETIQTARSEREKQEKIDADPLTGMTREKNLLETELAIRVAREALSDDD